MYDGVPFSGRLVKLRLKSNASSYGPIPEPDAEVEQKLEVSVKKKTARLSCYNFGNGAKYLLNQVYVRRESEKDIMDILAMFEAVFSRILTGRGRAYPTVCARYSTGQTSGRLRLHWRKKPMRAARPMTRIR